MTRIYALICALAVGLAGCSWFTSHVEPVIKPVTTCAGHEVTADNFNRALADLESQNYADLAAEGVTIGWDVLVCIIDSITSQKPALKANGDDFKREHSVEIRNARPVSLKDSNANPGDRLPGAGPASGSAPRASLAGPKMSACDAACGKPLTGLVTPSGCQCWRASKTDWRASRWVAAR